MRGLHPDLVVLAPVLQVAGAIVLQEGPSLVQPPGNRHQAGQEGILQQEIFNIFTDKNIFEPNIFHLPSQCLREAGSSTRE